MKIDCPICGKRHYARKIPQPCLSKARSSHAQLCGAVYMHKTDCLLKLLEDRIYGRPQSQVTSQLPTIKTDSIVRVSAEDIKKLLHAHYFETDKWIVLDEVRFSTGYPSPADAFYNHLIDVFVMNLFPSGHFDKIAFEVKVSRSDFLEELAHPDKRLMAMVYSNFFYFVAPKGIIPIVELPSGCGLLEVDYGVRDLDTRVDGYLLLYTRQAPRRTASPMSESFIASLLRNAARQK